MRLDSFVLDPTPAVAAWFREVETVDADEVAAAVTHADVRYLPLAAARCHWRLVRIAMPAGGALYSGRMGAATAGFGTSDPDTLCFAFRLGGPGAWTMNSRRVGPGTVAVRFRSREIGVRLDPGLDWAVVYVREDRFATRFRALKGCDAKFRPGIGLQQGRVRQVERLRRIVQSSRALAGGAGWDERCRGRLEDLLLDEIVAACDTPTRAERPEYHRLIGRCNDLLEAHPEALIAPADLCAALQVSERTLHRFFDVTYGQAPARFLRLRRLAAVRRALAAAPPGPGTITRVAMYYGFFELGRFAAFYNAVVGENPTDTLRTARARAGEVSGIA